MKKVVSLFVCFVALMTGGRICIAADQPQWIDFKGTAIQTGDTYTLLDWEGKRGLELNKADVKIEEGATKLRVGAYAKRMIRSNGTVDTMSAKSVTAGPNDLRTCCLGLAQMCCGNGRVIRACLGVADCNFGDDTACN